MTAREDKLAPSTWILWIMALAVCLGWNAFAPDQSDAAKEDLGKGIGLTHQSNDLPAPLVQPHPFTGLLPVACGFGGPQGNPPQRLGIEVSRERPIEEVRGGGIQGRAPPLGA